MPAAGAPPPSDAVAAAEHLLRDRGHEVRLGSGAALLARLDEAAAHLAGHLSADEHGRVAAELAPAAAEALAELLDGRAEEGEAGLCVVTATARLRVEARVRRVLDGGPGTPGLLALLARGRDAAAGSPPPPGRRARAPLGDDRPLGLRRAAFSEPEDTEVRPIGEVIAFGPGADEAAGDGPVAVGRGPSLFAVLLVALIVATVLWAIWLYRNAPP